jgi:hypothetical protein
MFRYPPGRIAPANNPVLCRSISRYVAAGPPGGDSASEYTVPPSNAPVSRASISAIRGLVIFSMNTARTFSRSICLTSAVIALAEGSNSVLIPSAERNSIPYRAP